MEIQTISRISPLGFSAGAISEPTKQDTAQTEEQSQESKQAAAVETGSSLDVLV